MMGGLAKLAMPVIVHPRPRLRREIVTYYQQKTLVGIPSR